MKILLVNLPWERRGYFGVRAGSRWPHIKTVHEKNYSPYPFFLAYAAALLKREGFEVKVIDSLAQEIAEKDFLQAVTDEKPDLLVAETSTPSLSNDLMVIGRLPQGLKVALCGPESNIRDPQFLKAHPAISYVMVGEYEVMLLELVQRLQGGVHVDDVKGLIHRQGAELRVNPPRPLLEDLDFLPWPLREGLPMDRYNDTPGGIPAPSVQMWSTRGCPYQCLFCIWPQLMYQSRRYRTRSVKDVVDEMEYLVKTMGFKSVYFDDDTMNIGKLRMMELAREIRRRALNVPWAMMARADIMEEDVLQSLHEAGLVAIKYGVESADQTLLNNIRKGMDLRQTERMIRFTKSIGIKTHLTFSFGLPGETQATIQKTIDLALELDPDSLQFSINTAFPGTPYYKELEQRGHIVSSDLSDYDGNFKAMLRTEALTAQDLLKAKRRADRVWRDHVWRTRHYDVGAGDLWFKFTQHVQRNGLVAALARVAAFLRQRINAARTAWRAPSFSLPVHVQKFFNTFMGSEQGNWPKVRKYWLNVMGVYHGSRAFKGPDHVQIDLTSDCNNNCVSCWCNSPLLEERMYKGAKKYKTLPTQMVLSLIDELAGLGTSELYFSGGGEPFMHKDILEILAHAKARGMHCAVNTNFTLVNERVVRQLIELSVDAMTVSFWAATAATYVLTHPNKDEATFYRMKDALKMLNALKAGRGPVIKIYNVISNLNYMELGQMVAFAEETGSESVEFTVVDTIPGKTDKLVLAPDQRKVILEQCERILKRDNKTRVTNLEHFMRRLGDVKADDAQYDSGLLGQKPCYVGWVFSRIMPDGDVNFCLKAHRIPVGNLYTQPFREIWNAAKQREFRRKALKFDPNDSFFQKIGNDENCKMGCYKSCDDLGRNQQVEQQLSALSGFEKQVLKLLSRVRR
ncbi:MAG: radical SAM protein [Candidatus Omnitrophica bacterium]|nr:radical SAM protein [Candidatus Omnitrophota bacterium]